MVEALTALPRSAPRGEERDGPEQVDGEKTHQNGKYATRAGALTSHFFGETEDLLEIYA